tara:strand:- start:182 stop:985 length:804 start_codon:yes stop_codon:yes gene_type:complete
MNKSKKGKGGNIWTFLRDNWYVASSILLTSVFIILLVILFFQKKPTNSNVQNETKQNNNENYITDIVVTPKDNKCPDGYWSAIREGGEDQIKVGYENKISQKSNVKLCYKIPDQISNTDSIITDLNFNEWGGSLKGCKSVSGIDCNNPSMVYCALDVDPNSTPNIANLQCRCKNCGDVPVGNISVIYDDKGNPSPPERNINCDGVLAPSNAAGASEVIIDRTLCSSQNIYNPTKSNQGITDIYLSVDCDDGYTKIDNTNICVLKKKI